VGNGNSTPAGSKEISAHAVQPGARARRRRIDSPNFVSHGLNGSNIETVSAGLDDMAFLNPDGSKVLVAYNNSVAPDHLRRAVGRALLHLHDPGAGDDHVRVALSALYQAAT
jgi:glycosyl hydrolase family 30